MGRMRDTPLCLPGFCVAPPADGASRLLVGVFPAFGDFRGGVRPVLTPWKIVFEGRSRKAVLSTSPAISTAKLMMPNSSRRPVRQFRRIQPMFSVIAPAISRRRWCRSRAAFDSRPAGVVGRNCRTMPR